MNTEKQKLCYSMADLMSADLSTDYLVENILVAGEPCVVAGPPKSMKTSIAIDLSLSLSTGGFFLGKFRVPKAKRVGMLSGESGLGTIRETCQRVYCAMGGKDLSAVTGLFVNPKVPRFDSAEALRKLSNWISAYRLQVVIVDPAYQSLPGEQAANVMVMGQLLAAANSACQDSGAQLILVHHTRKAKQEQWKPYGPLDLSDIAFAGFAEWCRQWILVGRREAYKPGSGVHNLHLGVGGSAGHSGLWSVDVDEGVYQHGEPRSWRTSVTTAAACRHDEASQKAAKGDAKAAARLTAAVGRLMDYLGTKPDGETPSVIRDDGKLNNLATDAINAAVVLGLVVPCKVSKYGKDYEGFKLAS